MHIKGIGINIDSPTIDGDLDLFEEALGDFQDIGFDYVEIPVHGVDAIFKGRLNWLQTRVITDILKKFKLKYTVHGPNLLNLMDPSNFQLQKDIFKSGIEFTNAIGAEIFVYHSGKIPLQEEIKTKNIIQNKFLKLPSPRKINRLKKIEIKTLQELATFAKDLGVTIAIENLSPDVEEESIWELSKRFKNDKMLPPSVLTPKTPKPTLLREISKYNYGTKIKELVEQVKKIDRENVGITFDFGHAYLASKYYHFKFLDSIKLALPYIKHVHIHDCFGKPKLSYEEQDINLIQFGIGDLHMPVGWGAIPYNKIFRILKNYQGVLNLELKPRYKKFYKYSLQKLEELVESTNNNHKIKKISPFSKHHH
ncbi:MAG: sugar phosphate isomerase/epimerase [Candidatus Caldatribacteriota bacterium]|nr:sugar phosphate isomerase/epimerase [Candidatus Caldatribacteriota bacterium]